MSTVAECPTCRSSMAVVEVDLVGRMARLLCGDCGLVEARRMPATAWRDS